ncbi:MAG: AAA family ATPase [Bacilli bacterium]|nr:AAA family ATPase [Bacilli bacterium]
MNIKQLNIRQKVISILRRNKKEESEEVEEEMLEDNFDLDDLMNYVSNRIVGQDEAIRTLISNILYNQLLLNEISEQETLDLIDLESRKISILLEGPTGTGKSAIINDIASKLAIPVTITNISKFFENDFSTNEILYDLLLKADGQLEFAERGIVVIDEIDKIANNSDYGSIDARKYIQEAIVALMSGEICQFSINQGDNPPVEVPFDTSKLTFVLSGDFSNLKKKGVNDRGLVKTPGFCDSDTSNENITIKECINTNMSPDFFKKIKVIANTKKYDIEDYENILLHSEISPLNNLVRTFKRFDYENVKYDSGLVRKLANDAYDMGVGARGLQILVSEVQNKVLYDIMTQKYNKNEEISLTKDLLETGRQRVRK